MVNSPRPLSMLNFSTYPVVATAYSALRAVMSGQPLRGEPPRNEQETVVCVGGVPVGSHNLAGTVDAMGSWGRRPGKINSEGAEDHGPSLLGEVHIHIGIS